MKRILLILAAMVFMAAPAKAGKVITDSIDSKILNAEVKYNVYLPTGFDKSEKQYPVIYLLHGLYGDHTNWLQVGRMDLVANELMGSGECAEAVIIMPCAGDNKIHEIWNGYFNMPGWNYEDFFFQEFIPAVEKKYRCISDKGHRAIMGLSMGGGGSTVYCQKHPDVFSSCYAMSAWLQNGETKIKEGDKYTYTCQSVHENDCVEFVKKADGNTLEQLRTVAWFFDCGDDDSLVSQSFELHMEMNKAKVKNELRVHNGAHTWEYWHQALRDALPFASRNFSK